MKKRVAVKLWLSFVFLVLFALWTALVLCVDVREIGPCGSSVGLATLNEAVHDLIGVNMALYTVTDALSLIPICVALGFAALGAYQLLRRGSIRRVDGDILILGVFYILVIGVYLLFEFAVVNYRPVLIEGALEASYPSSTTVLVTCIMLTALIRLRSRIKRNSLRGAAAAVIIVFTLFMVGARLISGVHWVSDIIGGALISSSLVLMYSAATDR